MPLAHLRLLSLLVSCSLTSTLCAQSRPQNVPSTLDSRTIVKPDPKRAKKLLELDEKEEAEGSLLDALSAYDDAARYAPFDVNIASNAVALRSIPARNSVETAERLAFQSELDGAP